MTIKAIADTHALIWYLVGNICLSAIAKAVFDDALTQGNQIGLSSVTFAEIVYLIKKGVFQLTHSLT